jgi:hypothetical protein
LTTGFSSFLFVLKSFEISFIVSAFHARIACMLLDTASGVILITLPTCSLIF